MTESTQLDSEMIATPIVSIDPKMLPVHREKLIRLYLVTRDICVSELSLKACKSFPFERAFRTASDENIAYWRNRYNEWFADLSPEDARALSVALIRSEI